MQKSVNTAVVSATFVCGNYPYTSEIPDNGVEHLTGPEFHKHCYQPIWCIVSILVPMRYMYPPSHQLTNFGVYGGKVLETKHVVRAVSSEKVRK
jgi:hypothetical protein